MKNRIIIVLILLFFIKSAHSKTEHEINIKYDPINHILPTVKIIVDKKEYDFILDTGNPNIIIFNTEFFKKKPVDCFLEDIKNNIVNIPTEESIGRDLSLLSKEYGKKIYGFIGFKFLSKYDFSLSLFHKKLILINQSRVFTPNAVQIVSIPDDPNLPFLPICYDGENTLDFLLDTGASICNIRESDIKSNNNIRFNFNNPDILFNSISRFGVIRLTEGIVDNFYFEKKMYSNIEIGISKNNTFVNTLGNNMLRRFLINFYREHKKISFEEIKIADKSFTNPLGTLGFSVKKIGNDFHIDYLRMDLGAGQSGLLLDDKIISINGRNLSSYEEHEIKNIDSYPLGTIIEIEYVRNMDKKMALLSPSDMYREQKKQGYGLLSIGIGKELIVDSVIENSSAHKLGISFGDVIYSANGVVYSPDYPTDFSKEMAKGKVLLKFKQSDSGIIRSVYIEREPLTIVPWLTRKRLLMSPN